MTGAIAMGTSKITGLGNPTSAQDAATKTYVDTADALKLNLTGGTMSGAIAMGTNKITGVGNPTLAQDAATKDYVDDILGSATSAATSAAAAATSASNAATSASNAASSATASANSASAAAASYDAFDDRYLGDKASDPTLDNDGNALLTGALYFNTTSDVMKVYDGSAWNIAAISSASPTFTGTVTADGLSLGDNDKATFGAGNDLQIYHDAGGTSHIRESGSSNLYIESTNFRLKSSADTGETYLTANLDGAVTLYYDNAAKLATTATGIDVTGTATMDGLTVGTNTGLFTVDATLSNYSASNGVYLNGNAGGWLSLRGDGTGFTRWTLFGGTTGNATLHTNNKNRIKVDGSTGDISFYEDTGTTPKFFWDASGEILGIGGSPNAALPATGTLLQLQRTGSSRLNITASNVSYSAIDFGDTDDLDVGKIEYYHANNTMYFSTNATNRMVIDSSGNVGIGTSSPATNLQIESSTGGNAYLSVKRNNATSTDLRIAAENGSTGISSVGAVPMAFYTNSVERMRIDASGNLLVGTTDTNPTNNSTNSAADSGIAFSGGQGWIANATYNETTAYFNRTGTDGTIIELIKSGTTVGSIGVASGQLYVGNEAASLDTGILFGESGTTARAILPCRAEGTEVDGALDIGRPTARWKDLYLSGTAIIGGGGTSQTGVISFVADSERARIEGGYQAGGGGYMKFNTDTTGGSNLERMRIDSSGNVGIATASPVETLSIGATTTIAGFSLGYATTQIYLRYNNYFSGTTQVSDATKGSVSISLGRSSDGVITFNTAAAGAGTPAERMRIDSAGNLLVGGTSAFADDATTINSSGLIYASRAGNKAGLFNRQISDGEIVDFSKDGTTVGSIGAGGGNLNIGNGTANLRFTSGSISPSGNTAGGSSDGVTDLGISNRRFKDLYLSGTANVGSVNIDQNNAFTNTNITSANTNTDKGNFLRFMQVASGSIPAPDFFIGHAGDNSGDAVLLNASSSSMKFYTNNTEKARIDASGNIYGSSATGLTRFANNTTNAITVADDATVTLLSGQAGAVLIHVYDQGVGDGAVFFATYKGGTVLVSESASNTYVFATSDTDNAYCVYKSGNSHTVTFKNRTGASRGISFLISGANAS